jgi:ribosome biogenesis protein NSA1
LNVGANIYCVKKCPFNQNLFATGGKENDLKLWDLEKDGNENIFKAKNVRTGV